MENLIGFCECGVIVARGAALGKEDRCHTCNGLLDQTWKVSRLNFVKYDSESLRKNEELKYAVQNVERHLLELPECRERSLAMTAMEEMFMWIGKTIRNDQLERERVGDG